MRGSGVPAVVILLMLYLLQRRAVYARQDNEQEQGFSAKTGCDYLFFFTKELAELDAAMSVGRTPAFYHCYA